MYFVQESGKATTLSECSRACPFGTSAQRNARAAYPYPHRKRAFVAVLYFQRAFSEPPYSPRGPRGFPLRIDDTV